MGGGGEEMRKHVTIRGGRNETEKDIKVSNDILLMSSEELSQRGLTKKGITIIDFEFFPLHSTTLKQYKKSKQ